MHMREPQIDPQPAQLIVQEEEVLRVDEYSLEREGQRLGFGPAQPAVGRFPDPVVSGVVQDPQKV